MISAPESSEGSPDRASFCKATIDAYSVPCDPDASASVGPGLAPFTTITAMLTAGSTPDGTWIKPVAFCPGRAVAVTTETSAARIAPLKTSINVGRDRRMEYIGISFDFLAYRSIYGIETK